MARRARANGEGSIYPYEYGWTAYVWVTRPDGKREREYIYGREREEVHERWIELQQKAKATVVPKSVPTVRAFITYWLDEVVKPNLAPLTYATYESHARLHVIPRIGGTRVDKLRGREVQTMLNQIAQTCQCCAQGTDRARIADKRRCCAKKGGECCKKKLAASSLKGVHKTIRAALTQAMIDELVTKNAAELVKMPSARRRVRRRGAWDTEQAYLFMKSAREADDYLYAAYVLVVIMGLRKGEALGLTWADVDVDSAQLNIQHQLQRVRGVLHHQDITKTDESEAPLPLVDMCLNALKLRREQQVAQREKAEVWHETDLVFTTRFGQPIEPRNFNRSFDAAIKRADVERITVHDARRTCGSMLAALGVHPRIAMQILRHAQFSMTMEIYTRVSSKDARKALQRIEKALDRNTPKEEKPKKKKGKRDAKTRPAPAEPAPPEAAEEPSP